MFAILKNKAVAIALNHAKEKLVNPFFEGIGVVREISFRDKMLYLTIALEGLEDRPIDIRCSELEIAPDGSSVTIHGYESNMPFAQNLLSRFAAKPLPIPEGGGRLAALAAKKALGL